MGVGVGVGVSVDMNNPRLQSGGVKMEKTMKIRLIALSIMSATVLFSGCTNPHWSDGPVQEGTVSFQGRSIWYRIVGADKPGIPLLALHGGPGAPHDYLESIEALADERPVIFYDQLGCGNSDRTNDSTLWTIDYFVEELAAVRKELGLKKVHILGQSWGSMLAVEYILREKPSGIKSLILAGPCMSTDRWVADQANWVSQLPDSLRQVITDCEASGDFAHPAYQEALMVFYHLHVCRLDPWPDCINRTFEKFGQEVYQYMWGPSEFSLTGTLNGWDRTEDLAKIDIPTLFTCGEFDEATPETTEYYHSKMPGSEIHVFMGASHNHHLESQKEFLQVVRDFLFRVVNFPRVVNF